MGFKKIEPKGSFSFRERFRGGERACVIVRGNHQPEVDLTVSVFDQENKLVAQVEKSGDLVAVIWYPPREAVYQVKVDNPGPAVNECYISLK